MNKNSYRLVYSRVRNMVVAAADFAVARGNAGGKGERGARRGADTSILAPALRVMAWTAMLMLGTASTLALSQIVAKPGSATQVLQTQNGLDQVNIARPSAAGVSLNNYSQFDVPGKGAILNNSPTLTQTQQAGYINGNANLTPGQEARIIVNQVMSNSPSQLRGYLEVAGPRAEVIVANPNGIVVDGGGFINTSRGILTTGTPNFGPGGNLAGFTVSGGNIVVQGAGLNATNIDQVDLIARAIQVNAAIYAKNLNVIAGANDVDHDTLNATPIAGSGPAPSLAIDVSQLGGMYANRIYLASNEYGVGVSTKGVIAAQAGDLTLKSNGQLLLAGTTNASGSISASASQGIGNSGTTYAQGNISATTSGTLTNSGMLAAQQTTTINAGSVASTGTLAAGVNGDGSLAQSGDLNVGASGAVTATGRNVAGGNANVNGGAVNLAGSINSANGALVLAASSGDLNLSGATTTAGGTLDARASGSLTNDNGAMSSGGAQTVTAGALSNRNGQIVSGGALTETVTGATNNQGGTMQANGVLSSTSGTFDNTNGRVLSLGADGVTMTTAGLLNNGAGGIIGGNGDVTLRAAQIANVGSVTAVRNLIASAVQSLFNSGTFASNANMSLTAGTTLTNAGQFGAARALALSAATFDNSNGTTSADQFTLHAANIVNRGGSMTQTGTGAMTLDVTGTFDNSAGGTLQTNSADLTLTPATLDNDGGTITHAGAGKLSINAGNGAGTLSNLGGKIASNGQVTVQGGALNNASGSIAGQNGLAVTVGGTLNNANGKLLSNTDSSLASGTLNNNGGQIGAGSNETIRTGALTNDGGSIVAPTLAVTTDGTLDNSRGHIEANKLALNAADLINRAGTITQYGASAMGFNVSGTFDNSNGGTFQTNSTDLTLAPGALINDGGTILDAGTGTLTIAPGRGAGAFSNVGGKIFTAGQIAARAGSLNNANGVLAAQGNIAANIAGDVNNAQGAIRSLASMSLTSGGALTNANGQIQSGTGAAGDASALDVRAASVDNTNGLVGNLGTGDTIVHGGSQVANSGGVMTANGSMSVDTSALVNTQNGQLSGANVAVQADTVDNSNGLIGNLSGSNGDVVITATGAIANTNGQIGATHDLSLNAAALIGGGAYSAAHDVAVIVQGDFAPTPDLQFNAGHDLAFTLPGTFTNGALLQAVNNLAVEAGDITNSGTMMAGGTLITHSNTLENTGALVGGSVSLNANSKISNTGPTALIGATDSDDLLEVLAPVIENRDDTTMTDTQATTAIYGLGKVVLAGGKNADGSYSNANLIVNQSGLIASAGDMELDAAKVTNTRTTMTTTGLNQSVDPALLEQLGISMSGCTAVVMAACSGQTVGWFSATPEMIGGVDITPPSGGQWNSGYQYTTYTGVALANLIAGISPQAQIVSGGKLDASNVGLFQNYWSAVTAVGDIASPVKIDNNSWQGQTAPYVEVTYSGYYHYTNYDHSIADWTLPFGDAPFVGGRPGGYTQVAPADIRTYALPSYESSFVAGGTLSGTGVSIDNTAGNAGIPTLGLAPGQALSGVNIAGVSGSAGGSKAGAANVNGGSGTVNPVIAGATAQNVLQNLSIPQGGLFSRATAPDATYLIATNPAFTNQKNFISSDYFLQQLGLDPQKTEKRLGDGFYEQQLVRNQMTSLTGRAVLGPYADLQGMYEALLAAGASLSKSLDLPLGMSLSPEQVAALTSNVVIMQTQIVDGQTVLVPVVYLAKSSQQNMNGPLIAATDIDFRNAQAFTNSGTIQAANTLSIQGEQIDNAFGTLQSGGLMSLATKGNVDLTSATVNAGSLALAAGGNVLLNTAVNTVNQISATGATRTTTTLGPIANLNVAGDALIMTGGNFEQNAGNLNVGGNLGMAIAGNYDLGAVQTGEHKVVERANGVSNTDINRTTGSSVKVGGVTQVGVGGDLTATGANIELGGGGAVVVNGNVTLQAAKATSTVDSNSSGSDSHGSYSESLHRSDDTLTATTLNSGDSLTVASGKNINVIGSAVNLDQGVLTLAAKGDVNIGAATETHVDNSQEQHSHSNGINGKEVASSSRTATTLNQGSLLSADAVTIASGNDINVKGSTIVGTNDVNLAATHDVNITTTEDTHQSSVFREEKKTGFGTAGIGISYGTTDQKDTVNDAERSANGSLIGSTSGNVNMQAGNTLHITGSDVLAAGNVLGTGADVIVDASKTDRHHDETHETHSSGFTLAFKSSVIDAVQTAGQQARAADSGSGNSRSDTLHAMAAAGSLINGANPMMNGAQPDWKVELSFGASSSKSTFTEDSTQRNGSTITAGGTAAFIATGNGTAGSGNVTIAGSNVNASDVMLAANDQVNLIHSTDTDSTRSNNESKSGSVGVSYGSQGFGVSASGSKAKGDANSDSTAQTNTHISGANSVSIVSSGDTNIKGATVNGGQVSALIGGDLNIASVQDTSHSVAHQESQSAGVSISQGGGSASFSSQHGDAHGDYAGVDEQSGIHAGAGGFDINVKGNTDLKGGVIASDADPTKNSLTTGTLTFSDITNNSNYSASSSGFSAGGSMGAPNSAKANGVTSLSDGGGVAPMISQHDSGNETATTKSAISAGTITITDTDRQTQDVASLNRDTTDLNGQVSKLPDLANLLNQQASTQQAAAIVAQTVATQIGNYAESKFEETGDPRWDIGGAYRIAMHVAGGAAVEGLGGGNVAGGAAGAGVSAALAGNINDVSNAVTGASPTGNADADQALGNILGNVLATGAGAFVGGSSGAATGSAANLYNDQLHCTNESCKGGTGQLLGDTIANMASLPGKWNALVDNGISQFNGLMNSDAAAKAGESPAALIAQGTANGINAIIGSKGGEPPMANPGAVLADSTASITAGSAGYVPSNATLNSGNGDVSNASDSTGSYDQVFGGRTNIENVTSRGTSIESVPNSNNATAANDFAALQPNNVKTVSTGRGDVSIGTLADGSTVILRPSKDGRTTIEFQNANGRTTKEIRYGSK